MESKRKIVLLAAFYEPFIHGAEQVVRELVNRLGYKYEIVIITARIRRDLVKYEHNSNYCLFRVGWGIKWLDVIIYPLLAALKTRSLRPEIAHANMESYAGGALVLLKFLAPHIKRILTLQSGNLDEPSEQRRLKIKAFWKVIHRAPHKITAISSFLANRAIKLGVKKENISIIPNGVDLTEASIDVERISGRVICVARLSWEKGLEYLLKAWPIVRKAFPGAKLVMVSDGEDRTGVEKMIKDLKISDSVSLKGFMPHREVLPEIKKSEIFVCPSLAEGLGVVFIEAQACGVPVIGTNVGGIPDVIQHGDNGLLIEPKNSDAIAKAIIKLLTDKELASRLKTRALETVKRFDWENIIKELDRIYVLFNE